LTASPEKYLAWGGEIATLSITEGIIFQEYLAWGEVSNLVNYSGYNSGISSMGLR